MGTVYPVGYGRELVDVDELRRRHEPRMHPAYARRLFAWLESRGGEVGIGGGWRATPSDTSQASKDGHSFHQSQWWRSGCTAYAAVDLVARNGDDVHRAPTWAEVPEQGTDHPDIAAYGVHCNVAGEPWHMQPVEVDGYQTWHDAGRPDPDPNYPLPDTPDPVPEPGPTPEIPDMFVSQTGTRYRLTTGDRFVAITEKLRDDLAAAGVPSVQMSEHDYDNFTDWLVAEE